VDRDGHSHGDPDRCADSLVHSDGNANADDHSDTDHHSDGPGNVDPYSFG